jgi:hypothetical protein
LNSSVNSIGTSSSTSNRHKNKESSTVAHALDISGKHPQKHTDSRVSYLSKTIFGNGAFVKFLNSEGHPGCCNEYASLGASRNNSSKSDWFVSLVSFVMCFVAAANASLVSV